MAQLVLENISPAIAQKLEQRAKRAGRTVEAEAVRLLEAEIIAAESRRDSELVTGQERTEAAPPAPLEAPSGGSDAEARALADRQAALADAYPEEYVILLGDRVVAHTSDKEEAYAHHDAAFEGDAEPIVIPPGALRRLPPPVIRGRAFAWTSGAQRT